MYKRQVLYESKVYSPFTPSPELGTGTRAGGGSVSTAGGHRRGFGGCEELLHVKIFGTKQRGRPGDDPFDHITTTGYVRARDGAYSDGIAKGHQVLALISESLGGIAPDARKLLIALDKLASTDGHRDGTKYGLARAHRHALIPRVPPLRHLDGHRHRARRDPTAGRRRARRCRLARYRPLRCQRLGAPRASGSVTGAGAR